MPVLIECKPIPFVCASRGAAVLLSPYWTERRSNIVSSLGQNTAQNRFEFDAEGATALAFYRLADGVMSITHTEVPAALRGRGIGSRMMRAVLDDVRRQGLKVIPRCPFVADYIGRNPEFADLLA
jgi:hypothetical protein